MATAARWAASTWRRLDPTRTAAGGERRDGAAVRAKLLLGIVGAVVVTGVLVAVLAGRRGQFVSALHAAPLSILGLSVALQVFALLARTEAWNISIRAAGGSLPRRLLFRAAGVGYLASVINGSVGMAVRIASLRRIAGTRAPRVPALLAAEVPIIAVEVALAAIFSFTLIAPLGIPWWVPAIAVVLMGGAVIGLRHVARCRRTGLWSGLAIVRGRRRGRMIAFTVMAVCAQVARNWLMLRAIGVDVSVFAAMAWLIAIFTLGQLPVGPSIGPAAAVLILGAHGVAATAAAGVLVAVTGITGSLCYAAWAAADQLIAARFGVTETPAAPISVAVPPG